MTILAVKELNIYNGRRPHNIDIQMKQKDLTKPFLMISNLNKSLGLHDLYKINSTLEGLRSYTCTCTTFSTWVHISILHGSQLCGGDCFRAVYCNYYYSTISGCRRSPVANIHPIFTFFFPTPYID